MANVNKRHVIVAPLSGTFYSRPSPDEDAFVKVGETILPDSIVCIVETMKVFNELRAEVNGIVKKIFVDDEDPVMIEQPLIEIELT